jgi:hypothetical protein
MQDVCLDSIAFEILELDVSLDCHIPCHAIDLAIVSYDMDRMGRLRKELRS